VAAIVSISSAEIMSCLPAHSPLLNALQIHCGWMSEWRGDLAFTFTFMVKHDVRIPIPFTGGQ